MDRIAAELLESYEEGRTDRVRVTEHGSRGAWVSLAEVIRLGLDELEDHKARSRRSSRKARKSETVQDTTSETDVA